MKKIIALALICLFCASAFAAMDFSKVDQMFLKGDCYETEAELLVLYAQAKTNEDKAEVLWRLSRVTVDIGDRIDEKDKDAKFATYEKGEQYAIESINLKPNAMAYLWKCSNIGRWGQTKGALNSLSKAKPMYEDLKAVINDFNCLDSSEAWYVLASLYDQLPGKPLSFGDSDAAISYGRIACETISSDVIYGGTYKYLAEMLYNRDWSVKKRKSEIAKMEKTWNKGNESTIDLYKSYEGSKGVDAVPMWSTAKLSEMTDRQEAVLLLKYAQAVYKSRSFHTSGDDKNYQEIEALIKEWT